ncbi:MAG TPA: hypothetical protein VGE76_12050 [Opitutaceae bacterium]
MSLKKLFIAAVATVAISTATLSAQEGKRGGFSPEQRIERLEQAVGSLTADQKTKIKAIYAKSTEKMQALPEGDRREKGMEIMRESQKEVRAVLTAEQQAKFDAMPQGGRGQGGGGGERKKKQEN